MIDGVQAPVSFSVSVTFRADETVSTGNTQVERLTGNYVNFITDAPSDTSVRAVPMEGGGSYQPHNGINYYAVTSDMTRRLYR